MHSLQSSPVLIDSPRSERVYLFIACQALLKKGYTRPDSSPYPTYLAKKWRGYTGDRRVCELIATQKTHLLGHWTYLLAP